VGNVVRRVAVSGSGLAGCWSHLLGRALGPLTGMADSSPSAEIPQSLMSHGSFPSGQIGTASGPTPRVVMGGDGDANYNLWDIWHKSVAVAVQVQPRQPRRNCAEVLPKRREHILNGRAGMSAGVL
jgi:hypothetical protein